MKPTELFSRTALKDKISIVTGAGKGLGKEMAFALARAGSDLVLVARHQEEIDRVAQEVRGIGQKVFGSHGGYDTVRRNFKDGRTRFTPNSGESTSLSITQDKTPLLFNVSLKIFPEGEWNSLIQTNITGVFLVTQIVGKTMLIRGSGKIINIASSFGVRPVPNNLCYGVSKAAVIQMTKGLALEWGSPRDYGQLYRPWLIR